MTSCNRVAGGLRGEVHHAARVAVGQLLEALSSPPWTCRRPRAQPPARANAHAASVSATVLVRVVSTVGTMMRKKGVFSGGLYAASFDSHGAQSLVLASTKYSYTVSFAGTLEIVAHERVKLFAARRPATRPPTTSARTRNSSPPSRGIARGRPRGTATGRGLTRSNHFQSVEQRGELPHRGELVRLHQLRAALPPELQRGLHPLGQERVHRGLALSPFPSASCRCSARRATRWRRATTPRSSTLR